MLTFMKKSRLCASRIVIVDKSRQLVSTPIYQIQTSDSSWVRRVRIPTVGGRLLKDSDFIDTELKSEELDVDVGHLERSYDEYRSEIKDEKRKLRKMLTKKKMEKHPKEPNMLTFSEREHIKFLHASDPVEWSVERLSESFPVLPYAIKRILRNKWNPSSLERIKKNDAHVLDNWEKLKRNELEASPAMLEHVKKFINKYDNLKAQLENPKFFPEPDIPKKVTWGDGPLTRLLEKYEKDIERLKSRHLEKNALEPGRGNNEVMGPLNEKNQTTIEEDIEMEMNIKEMKGDSFMIGKSRSFGKQLTLDDLKQSILEKTEKEAAKPLSKFEKVMLDKTLQGGRLSEKDVKVKEETKFSHGHVTEGSDGKKFKSEKFQNRSDNDFRDIRKEKLNKDPKRAKESTKTTPQLLDDEKANKDLREDDQTHNLSETDVGQFLQRLLGEEDQRQEQSIETEVKNRKTPVMFYGTEKDKEMVEKDHALLWGSSFWGSGEKPKRSKDAATLDDVTISTKASPHLSPTMKTYFTYDYPDKIEIPKDKLVKGKTYRVKDCYYDDDGEFLYRVPGVTQD